MSDIFRGRRPDITPAQVAAVLIAGVPAIATLLASFGVATLDRSQQDALTGAVTWCSVLAGLLIGGDATLRTARNVADARRDSAAMALGASQSPAAPDGVEDPEVDRLESVIVVSDDEEFLAEDDGAHLDGRGPADDPDLVGSEQ
jgi:hypothetical protein